MKFLRPSAPAMPAPESALPGRPEPMPVPDRHFVNGRPLQPPYPDGFEVAEFALGCFWGEEKLFWQVPGVWVTAVGYQGGLSPNPTYREVCTGRTGHAEAVRVVFDPEHVSYEELLRRFWEAHDPTQGMRQGNDVGTQYRSAIFVRDDAQRAAAERSKALYQERLSAAGYGEIQTEIVDAAQNPFYFAEEYHQQYLAKNPNGYCPNHATGVKLPDEFVATPLQYVD
ncbi:MAG TPA: peptide-methionine (S)-S-oxide reductase MsrA [Candidatus Limnocylindrales bacterium]|nr:peptide-methionine (S)-S-oxide reductase MsrA [Candidatus Limnocylindrales bacterium]